MSIIRSNKNKTISHKLKRTLAFAGWRKNISGKNISGKEKYCNF